MVIIVKNNLSINTISIFNLTEVLIEQLHKIGYYCLNGTFNQRDADFIIYDNGTFLCVSNTTKENRKSIYENMSDQYCLVIEFNSTTIMDLKLEKTTDEVIYESKKLLIKSKLDKIINYVCTN